MKAKPTKQGRKKRNQSQPKLVQSPEGSGEELETPGRESYPDPRWMNFPQKYIHLRDHRFKYISKITNKLLDDPEWASLAKSYQERLQKKTGAWASLNEHLCPEHKDDIPPCVNPLESILELILKYGPATPDHKNKDPSLKGAFIRLITSLVNNQDLADSIEQDLCDNVSARERTAVDETAVEELAAQQESPRSCSNVDFHDDVKSLTASDFGSPHLGLDLFDGTSQQICTFSQESTIISPASTTRAGPGSARQFTSFLALPPGFSGPALQTGNGFETGYVAPGPNISNRTFRIESPSISRITPGSPVGNTIIYGPFVDPQLHAHISNTTDAQELPANFGFSPTGTTSEGNWKLDDPLRTPQDSGLAPLGPDQYFQTFGTPHAQDSFQEYHTPPEHARGTYAFLTDGPDNFWNFMIGHETLDSHTFTGNAILDSESPPMLLVPAFSSATPEY